MLEIVDVHKAFTGSPVLRGVNLQVAPGQVLGLVGANGAGKTTLIRVVTGLLAPDSGRVRVGNAQVGTRHRAAVSAMMGLAPQQLGIYPTLTVGENLTGFARLHGVPRRQVRARAEQVAATVGLTDRWGQRAGELSGGQQRRLHTGLAVLHRPRLLFLDEPTVGADVRSRAGILQIVRDLAAEGTAVVYTTHYLPELEQLAADVAVLDGGVIVERGSTTELVRRWGRASVRLRFTGPAPQLPGWAADGQALLLRDTPADPGTAAATALAALGPRANDLVGVDIARPGLESAYLAITGHRLHEEDDDDLAA